MKIKNLPLSFFIIAMLFSLSTTGASAREAVRCETRADPPRSRIWVNFENLNPNALYTVEVVSGSNSETSLRTADIYGEFEIDFDSNPKNIRNGAIEISPDFIMGGHVTATLFTTAGTEVDSGDADCEMR